MDKTGIGNKEKKQLINESKKSLMLGEGEMMLEVKEMNKKQVYFDQEKKKYYDWITSNERHKIINTISVLECYIFILLPLQYV